MPLRVLAIRGETAFLACEKQDDATRLTNAVAFSLPGLQGLAALSGVLGKAWERNGVFGRSYEGATLWADTAVDVHVCDIPWRAAQLPAFFAMQAGRHLFLPAYGWKDGVWYDAPVVFVDDGKVISYVTEGTPCALEVGGVGGDAVGMQDELLRALTASGRVTSLVCAARCAVDSDPSSLSLFLDDFSLGSLVSLVLVRKAFLSANVHVTAPVSYKLWPSSAKRLCQNLGISLYEASAAGEALPTVIAMIRAQIAGFEHELAKEINKLSAVIPQSLLTF